MGGHDDGTVRPCQRLGESVHQPERQVVRRFVQDQQLRPPGQAQGQMKPALLPLRHAAHAISRNARLQQPCRCQAGPRKARPLGWSR